MIYLQLAVNLFKGREVKKARDRVPEKIPGQLSLFEGKEAGTVCCSGREAVSQCRRACCSCNDLPGLGICVLYLK